VRVKKRVLVAAIALLTMAPFLAAGDSLNPPKSKDPLAPALWWLYHLQYDKALDACDRYIRRNGDDPAGYFYQAAIHWWHLAQDAEYEHPDIEQKFYDAVDKTDEKAQARLQILDESDPEDAAQAAMVYLYWGGAEGLRGRWLVTQKKWLKAYFAGRDGDRMLKKALKLDPKLYDAYMGLGIYDYFSDTLSGFVAALSAVFVRGDRHRGIQELNLAIEKGKRARVESMVFLAEIYTFEENTPAEALSIVSKLRQEFPNSPLMHLMQITALYQMKKWPDVERESQILLSKAENETPWYTHRDVSPAVYCLGVAELLGKKDLEGALKRFNRLIDQAKADDPSRWLSFAHLRRAQIYDVQGKRDAAVADYKFVLDRPEIWGSHTEAAAGLKEPYKLPA
jgi:hypothetical protein